MSSLDSICWMAVEPRYAPEGEALLHSLRARDGSGGDGADGVGDDGRGDTASGTASGRGGRGRRRHNDRGVVWDDAALDAFMAAPQASYRRVRAFGDVLAARPGEQFTTSAACASAGLAATALRAALGKFSSWIHATSIQEQEWPFGWAFGGDVDPDNPFEFHYEMSEAQAASLQAARDRKPETPR
jgi:hypothetical protein